ncbi:helix-turn-helix transcriptional regulator [Lacticaseibacillus yichunensis]|uniref:AraC family transcriptional regulator n=1 Tax=Lacticaseibacillus yichunensis TaxID=2486015 RepID=A0ABW4CP61_9LACO|nr:AraC family transcriptional regulator [Lacticaseibacillus yichunensis]
MIDLKSFSPDVLYAFAYMNEGEDTSKYHEHDFPELSVMLEGFSDYTIEGHQIRVQQGQAVLLNPHVHHNEHQPAGSHSYQLYIGFRHVVLPGLTPDHFPFKDPVLRLEDQQPLFFNIAQRIIGEVKQRSAFGHDLLLQAYVTELVCILMRALPDNAVADDHLTISDSETSTEQQAMVSSAAYYLDAHFADDLTLARVADYLHVSEAHLSRTFKQLKGQSPMTYLMQVRLAHAQKILGETDLPIKDVAASVGYHDPFYFSRLYKKVFGSAPSYGKERA